MEVKETRIDNQQAMLEIKIDINKANGVDDAACLALIHEGFTNHAGQKKTWFKHWDTPFQEAIHAKVADGIVTIEAGVWSEQCRPKLERMAKRVESRMQMYQPFTALMKVKIEDECSKTQRELRKDLLAKLDEREAKILKHVDELGARVSTANSEIRSSIEAHRADLKATHNWFDAETKKLAEFQEGICADLGPKVDAQENRQLLMGFVIDDLKKELSEAKDRLAVLADNFYYPAKSRPWWAFWRKPVGIPDNQTGRTEA